MLVLKALIARIEERLGRGQKAYLGTSKQLASMLAALRDGVGSDDFLRNLVHHHLGFQRVPLFLAGIAAPLFFLGRSTGVSVASTSTTS